MSGINYSEKIPNNVNLSGDRALQRALEHWQPNSLQWWREMGPAASQNFDVYLRTSVSVPPAGWEIGRAHASTPVTNAYLLCCLRLGKTDKRGLSRQGHAHERT